MTTFKMDVKHLWWTTFINLIHYLLFLSLLKTWRHLFLKQLSLINCMITPTHFNTYNFNWKVKNSYEIAKMSSSRELREMYEAKQKAVKYYNENGVPQKIEEIMNTMFYDNPNDVYGYLVGLVRHPLLTKQNSMAEVPNLVVTCELYFSM